MKLYRKSENYPDDLNEADIFDVCEWIDSNIIVAPKIKDRATMRRLYSNMRDHARAILRKFSGETL